MSSSELHLLNGLLDEFEDDDEPLSDEIQRAWASQIFAQVPVDSELADRALARALTAELALEELPTREQMGEEADLLRNSLGRDLAAGFFSRRALNPLELEALEVAYSLFSASGFTAKAAALHFASFRGMRALAGSGQEIGQGETRLDWLVRETLGYFVRRDFKALSDQAARLEAVADSRRVSRDHARLALVLADMCRQLDQVARHGVHPEDIQSMQAKLRLMHKISVRSSDGVLLAVVSRLARSVQRFLQASLAIEFQRREIELPASYKAALTGRGSAHPIFELWPSQAAAVRDGFLADESWVLSLPTSAGKTFLAELKAVRTLQRAPTALVLYVAPYVALANQVAERLRPRLQQAGLAEPIIWTGSYEIDPDVQNLGNLVVTTPEKFDFVIRAYLEEDARSQDLTERLKLVVLDECHVLATERGLTYEMLISRLKNRFPGVQICAMSAVVGNPGAIATWITGDSDNVTTSGWRPTETSFYVYMKNGEVLDGSRSTVASASPWATARKGGVTAVRALAQSGEWPVFVMETRRDWAEAICSEIADAVEPNEWPVSPDALSARERVAVRAENLLGADSALPTTIRSGVAFHHAGLPSALRFDIEGLIRSRYLRVVCSTTTLAEGIDLPFRAIVVPHLYFEGAPMDRALFQNIAGRAGRAFVSTRGIVVFMQPGQPAGLEHLFTELIGQALQPTNIRSSLPHLTRRPVRPSDWRMQWRYQSQVLGMVGDKTFGDNQAAGFMNSTFGRLTASPAVMRTLQRKTSVLLNALTENEPPFAVAASPYRLTPFGQAACLSGLSADSVNVIRRELLRLVDAAGDLFSEEAWSQPGVAATQRRLLIYLAFTPLEALATSTDIPQTFGAFSDAIRSWTSGERELHREATRQDRNLVERWLAGEDLRGLADIPDDERPSKGPLRAKSRTGRLLDLNDYFARMSSFLAWMYSGVIRISDYLRESEDVAIPESLKKGIDYLRLGVDNDSAAVMVDRLSVPRAAAAVLAARISVDPDSLEESLLSGLSRMSRDELVEMLGEPLAGETAESLWGASSPPA
jgi:hypothetical protein